MRSKWFTGAKHRRHRFLLFINLCTYTLDMAQAHILKYINYVSVNETKFTIGPKEFPVTNVKLQWPYYENAIFIHPTVEHNLQRRLLVFITLFTTRGPC